jgi:acyl-coenzyme A synthetase/AMP-(fatty) acid ligase
LIRRKAELLPDKRILTFTDCGENDVEVTYGLLEQESNQLAAAMLDCGIGPGKTIVVLLDNVPEMMYLLIACSKIGAIFAPLDRKSLSVPEKLAFVVESTQCKAIYVAEDDLFSTLDLYRKHLSHLKVLKTIFSRRCGSVHQESAPVIVDIDAWGEKALPTVDLCGRDEKHHLVIFYTSGTTGIPKGILWTNDNYTSFGRFPGLLGYAPEETDYRIYTGLPLCHSNAHGITIMNAIWKGFEAVINRRWTLSRLWPLMRKYNIRSFCTIGNMALEIYRHSLEQEYVPNPVTHVVDGGLPGYLWEKFSRKFGVEILEAYSQVDGGATCINPPSRGAHRQRVGSIGKPVIGWEMQILDGEDRPCGPASFDREGRAVNIESSLGEIVSRRAKGTAPPVTYLNDEEGSRLKTRGGWHRSGDFGYKDEDGFYYICHREGENIRRAGKYFDNFDVDLIQKVILEQDDVFLAHTFPVGSMEGVSVENEIVVALVSKQDGTVDIGRLVAACQEKLPSPLYYPSFFMIIDIIPMTITGKPRNNELRKLFQQSSAQIIPFSASI